MNTQKVAVLNAYDFVVVVLFCFSAAERADVGAIVFIFKWEILGSFRHSLDATATGLRSVCVNVRGVHAIDHYISIWKYVQKMLKRSEIFRKWNFRIERQLIEMVYRFLFYFR